MTLKNLITTDMARNDSTSSPQSSGPAARPPIPQHRHAYRYDLDGLRGLAIALVVIFHIWFGRVSGGVDVFLTLSGFFFIGSQMRNVDRYGSLNPLRSIWKTARRLLPTMVVVLAAVGVGVIFIFPRTRWANVNDQVLASLFYYQNWKLAEQSEDYAQAGAAVSPLQHLWSMSVQGQFYVIIILLCCGLGWLLHRFWPGKSIFTPMAVILGIGTVLSFIYAIYLHREDQMLNYYNTWSRMWELFLGGLLATVMHKIQIRNHWVRWFLTVVGLFAIFTCGLIFNGVQEFPGPWTLYVLIATVFLIIAGQAPEGEELTWRNAPFTAFLASKPLRELGRLAYSLYMWHWPLLILLCTQLKRQHPSNKIGVFVVVVSLVLAWFTHHYIEEPLRMKKKRPVVAQEANAEKPSWKVRLGAALRPKRSWLSWKAVAGTMVVILTFCLVGFHITWKRYITSLDGQMTFALTADYPGARAITEKMPVPKGVKFQPRPIDADRTLPLSSFDGCISDFNDSEIHDVKLWRKEKGRPCVYGDVNAKRSIALVGGSHAEHWLTALDTLGQREHFRVDVYFKMGCPLMISGMIDLPTNNKPYYSCLEWGAKVYKRILEKKYDYVFSTATRPTTLTGVGPDIVPDYYADLWRALNKDGIQMIAVRDTPWSTRDDLPANVPDCLESGGNAYSCGIPRDLAMAPVNPAIEASSGLDNVHLMDFTDDLCPGNLCPAVIGNVMVYHDMHHMTHSFVQSLIPEFARQFNTITGWGPVTKPGTDLNTTPYQGTAILPTPSSSSSTESSRRSH